MPDYNARIKCPRDRIARIEGAGCVRALGPGEVPGRGGIPSRQRRGVAGVTHFRGARGDHQGAQGALSSQPVSRATGSPKPPQANSEVGIACWRLQAAGGRQLSRPSPPRRIQGVGGVLVVTEQEMAQAPCITEQALPARLAR